MQIATTLEEVYNYCYGQYTVRYFNTNEDICKETNNYDIYIIEHNPKVSKLQHKGKIIYYGNNFNGVFAAAPYAILQTPIQSNILFEVLNTCIAKMNEAYIFITQFTQCSRLYIQDINYVNIEDRSLKYHMTYGNESTTTIQTSFKKATPLINHPSFIFLSPALLININNIKTLGRDFVTFDNGDICYFPRTKYQLIVDKIKDISD